MRLVCLIVAFVMNVSCDKYVERDKYDAAMQQLAEARQQLEKTELKLTTCEQQPKHHYELRNEGLRTWRFDSSTGETCVQLTSDADWKKPDIKRQSCVYRDYLSGGASFAEAECAFLERGCDRLATNSAPANK